LLGKGYYLRRHDDKAPSGTRQFGLSLRYTNSQ
jgi:hypothetical protein